MGQGQGGSGEWRLLPGRCAWDYKARALLCWLRGLRGTSPDINIPLFGTRPTFQTGPLVTPSLGCCLPPPASAGIPCPAPGHHCLVAQTQPLASPFSSPSTCAGAPVLSAPAAPGLSFRAPSHRGHGHGVVVPMHVPQHRGLTDSELRAPGGCFREEVLAAGPEGHS